MDAVDQVSLSLSEPFCEPADDRLAAAGKIRRHAITRFSPVVAPEVEARIVARCSAGERASAVGRDLKMTPREVHTVLRAHKHDAGTSQEAT